MSGESKIVGLRPGQQLDPDSAEVILDSVLNRDPPTDADDAAAMVVEQAWDADEEQAATRRWQWIAPILFALGLIGWSALFLYANRSLVSSPPTAQQAIALLANWCVPVATLALFYLLYMRNSTREAGRFSDVANQLGQASADLEMRLHAINSNLDLARNFLADESRSLESLGARASEKIAASARQVQESLAAGLADMERLDEVGGAAYKNLENLRGHLPVVTSSAKELTNQIGNAGRTAQAEVTAMVVVLQRIGEVGTAASQSLKSLQDRSGESLEQLQNGADTIRQALAEALAQAEINSHKIATRLSESTSEFHASLKIAQDSAQSESRALTQNIKRELSEIDRAIAAIGAARGTEEERLGQLIAKLDQNLTAVATEIDSLDSFGGEKTANLAFSMAAMEENSGKLATALASGHAEADGLIARVERLMLALDSSAREIDETLPAALDRIDVRSEQSLGQLSALGGELARIDDVTGNLGKKTVETAQQLTSLSEKMSALKMQGEATTAALQERMASATADLERLIAANDGLTQQSGEKLVTALQRVKEVAMQAAQHSRAAMEESVTLSAEALSAASRDALDKIISEKIAAVVPSLQLAVDKALSASQTGTVALEQQLTRIEEKTATLESRIGKAKEQADAASDDSFSRRVATLTESLNSIAIDVTKILSNDVTDPEWAAYLKGDRGIFTRRAVRLIDAGESREILQQYENDSEFHTHVNRYIHDFEAMIRTVLAARDGSNIGITLLSSDMGKLYVALAQAIERLRN